MTATAPIVTCEVIPALETWSRLFFLTGTERLNRELYWDRGVTRRCPPQLKGQLRRYKPLEYWYVELDYSFGGYRAPKTVWVQEARIWEAHGANGKIRYRRLQRCPWQIPSPQNGSARMVVRKCILRPFCGEVGVTRAEGFNDALRAISESHVSKLRPVNQIKQSLRLKACQRCGGDVLRDADHDGPYEQCLQCTHTTYPRE